jgi:hypothetical protein
MADADLEFSNVIQRVSFPEDLTTDQIGHWMNISAYRPGMATASDTVSLFVPGGGQNTLTYETKYDYADVMLTRVASGVAGIGPFVSALNAGMNMFGGTGINPKVEVLFRNVELRKFQYVFLFSPMSEKESLNMYKIIKMLRCHSAPELNGGESDPQDSYIGSFGAQYNYLTSGLVWKTPSEFIIKFWRKNGNRYVENDTIPKIGRCVMEHIDVNYTPQGEFSTFSNGHPVSAMLTMVFRELRIIDRKNILDGNY